MIKENVLDIENIVVGNEHEKSQQHYEDKAKWNELKILNYSIFKQKISLNLD